MAATKSLLASALVRLAKQQGDAVAYLTGLLAPLAKFITSGDGRTRVGTSTGGSSASWTLLDGMTAADALEVVELALQIVETNVDATPTYDEDGNLVCVPTIGQLPNSKRTTSYGQFGAIQH